MDNRFRPFVYAPALVITAALLTACGQRDAATPQTPAPAGEAMSRAIDAEGAARQAAAATDAAASAAQQSAATAGAAGDSAQSAVAAAARAAVAAGADGVFLECHPNPDKALCDGPNSLSLTDLPALFRQLAGLWRLNDVA